MPPGTRPEGEDTVPIAPASDQHTETAATRDYFQPVHESHESLEGLKDAPVFQMLDFVNAGGCGEVWTSRQDRLDRLVAIKRLRRREIHPRGEDSVHESMRRSAFLREAAITAHLEHPNIVPVYDLGRAADGAPVIAMKLIKGRSWQQLLAVDFPAMAPDAFLMKHLPIFQQMMQAVAFAHSRHIVHRDLKPSQVMVGEFGEVLLMDWGLAVSEQEIADPARPMVARGTLGADRTPDVVAAAGTPALMAPEQTEGVLGSISLRTDIYLLGGILYYLLTGTFPHTGRDSAEAIRMASRGVVQPPRERSPSREMPQDLLDLCMRALSAKPEERPADVGEVIRAVEDHFTGATGRRESEKLLIAAAQAVAPVEPLVIQPGGEERRTEVQPEEYSRIHDAVVESLNLVDQASKHWSKNPQLGHVRDRVNATYARLAVLSGDLRLGRYLADRLENKAAKIGIQRALTVREKALEHERRSRRFALSACALLAVLFVAGGVRYSWEQRQAGIRLGVERDQAELARRKAEVEQYFSGIRLARARVREGKMEDAASLLLNELPEWPRQWEWNRLMAESSLDVMTLLEGEPPGGVHDGIYSPDGKTIATGDSSGAVVVWDASTGRALLRGKVHTGPIWCVRYSPDGQRILTASFDTTGAILDAKTLKEVHRLTGPTDILRGAAWRPDGGQVAATSRDGALRFWDAETGALQLEARPGQPSFYDIDYSPDGRFVATGGYRLSGVYEAATGKLVYSFPELPENLLSIRYSPDGTKILSACTDRNARIYDAATGTELVQLKNETSWLHIAEWSPDGTMIATGDNLGSFRLWNPETGERLASYSTVPTLFKVAFSPDGKRLLTVSQNAAKLWDLAELKGLANRLPAVGKEALLTHFDERMRWNYAPLDRPTSWYSYADWIPPGGRVLFEHEGLTFAVDSYFTAISPDGTRRAEIDRKTTELSVIDTATDMPIACPDVRRCMFALWSPNDDYLVTGDLNGEFALWDVNSWRKVRTLGVAEGPPRAAGTQAQGIAAFTPDGKELVIGSRSGYITMYEVASGDTVWQARPDSYNTLCMGFDRTGSLLAVGGVSQRATVHNARTGEVLSTIRGHNGGITSVSFTPDGKRLMTTAVDDTARLWDPFTGREVMSVFQDTSQQALMSAAFTKDGKHAWALMDDGTAIMMESFISLDKELSHPSPESPRDRVEIYKRHLRTGQPITAADVAVRTVGDELPGAGKP